MSFKITVPRCESQQEFEDAIFTAEVNPKADARTKVGKRQNQLAEAAMEALLEMVAYVDPELPCSGAISGHVGDDLSGNVTVTLNLLV